MNWTVTKKIRIQTKFGLTDELIVNDSLRQGKPLSGPEFLCFIDDLNCKGFGNEVSISNHYIIVIHWWHIHNCRKWTRTQ